jgi:hypothetical protein
VRLQAGSTVGVLLWHTQASVRSPSIYVVSQYKVKISSDREHHVVQKEAGADDACHDGHVVLVWLSKTEINLDRQPGHIPITRGIANCCHSGFHTAGEAPFEGLPGHGEILPLVADVEGPILDFPPIARNSKPHRPSVP